MIKNITLLLALYTFVGAGLSYFIINTDFAASFMVGGLTMLLNLAGLAFLWRLIFSKKSIALAVFVIIFKYVILGMILWSLLSVNWLMPIGFIAGLGSLVFAIVTATIIKSFTDKSAA
ncbi:hypothetical protein K2P97_01905 [bacterium]|nr:hypothetical protein [bacterium]